MATKKKPAPAPTKKAAPKTTRSERARASAAKPLDVPPPAPTPHAGSPVLADAVPEGAPAAVIVETPTGSVLKIDPETPATHPFLTDAVIVLSDAPVLKIGSADAVLPPCGICGGEMTSNVCPTDGYHLVDAP